uniref:Pleckstrin homology domain containing, family M (with RUN domain) member 1 n=1 Tax=Tetraodon nigroviridis TaxID=99883 RepID=H3DA97_TETNG
TQSPDAPVEPRYVQQIKEKLAQSLKALQKRYVTLDVVVTSEDGDANALCCALEAIFIHGIRSKYISSNAGSRSRRGDREPVPQPFFWRLLKSVTHRDVISELEKISFVSTDVGRCRAWLRLALNHGLLECYLASLFREDSKLRAHYQHGALLLNAEEREVLLSYLQGLASLTFNLSYKSAVLNEWTTTPLALAGLCPMFQTETHDPLLNGGGLPPSHPTNKELWDTESQSSSSSDAPDVQKRCPVLTERASGGLRGCASGLNTSSLSLDTTGSSQLSSSLSSDSLLQGQEPRSPAGEHWSSCDLDINVSGSRPPKDVLNEFQESSQCSQDSMREDSFVSSTGPDQYSETAIFSCSDSETQSPPTPPQDQPQRPDPEVAPTPPEQPASSEEEVEENPAEEPAEECEAGQVLEEAESGHDAHRDVQRSASVLSKTSLDSLPVSMFLESVTHSATEKSWKIDSSCREPAEKKKIEKSPLMSHSLFPKTVNGSGIQNSAIGQHSRSWISEDDIHKPHRATVLDHNQAPAPAPSAEPKATQSPPSVVHRRQIGLANPFRGLLKLGHLERRSAVGLWRDYYCELSPFEFRLYLDAEERSCYDNCSLVRCEGARITSPDGRFDLVFPGKRLSLRAANRDEAEDWIDRIVEAIHKCRPAFRIDDQWEVLQPCSEAGAEASPPVSASSGPEQIPAPVLGTCGGQEKPPPAEYRWTRTADVETDAIKEGVLYLSTDPEARTWVPLVFSLLEAVKGFQVEEGKKMLRRTLPVQEVRDVVPDVSLGGPEFFKLLTLRETLRLRAENGEEARSWRALIRGALDSYLESGEDSAPAAGMGWSGSGNLQRLVQHRLKEDGALCVHLCTVPSERGLDAQNFKCAGCPQRIGPSLSRARLCHFSGQYYCQSCHRGDTTIIPSRMVHNWDLSQREVCTKALWLLAQVEQEPLFNLEQLNPELVKHSEPMAQTHRLRQKLRLLGDYLLSCRSGACRNYKPRMEQRTYLLEFSHLYSVLDLRQIAEGQYATYLITLMQYASKHVYQCDLCTQRGFICQICRADDIIFPFQFDSTTRCKDCKTVFHLTCKSPRDPCPRCQRMRRYMERDLQD